MYPGDGGAPTQGDRNYANTPTELLGHLPLVGSPEIETPQVLLTPRGVHGNTGLTVTKPDWSSQPGEWDWRATYAECLRPWGLLWVYGRSLKGKTGGPKRGPVFRPPGGPIYEAHRVWAAEIRFVKFGA